MFKKLFLIIFILSFSLNIQITKADEELNTTSYSSNIWLSKDDFFDGEKIRIYAEFENKNNYDLENTIQFYDNEKLIDEKTVPIAAHKKIVVWTDNIFEAGKHKIIAKIKEAFKDDLDKKEPIEPDEIINLKIIDIDQDTDGDGVGDKIDTDDDNDGYLDTEEEKEGSDPKSKTSTPKIEAIKKKTADITQETKKVTQTLLEVLQEKRESISQQLEKSIKEKEKSEEEIVEQEKKKEKEIKLIKTEKKKKDFEKIKTEKKKIFKDEKNIQNIIKKTESELKKIEEKKLSQENKKLERACLLEAKYEKIAEIKKEKNNFFFKAWLIILGILSYIFKSNFLTILFFIFLFWLLWKIIKKF